MSNAEIERATTTTADMVAAGLEQHARAITARVIQLLAEDRQTFLKDIHDLHDMMAAIATELAATRKEGNEKRGEMLAGITGLSQQLSEYEALIPPAERIKIAEMVYRHDDEIKLLLAWKAQIEAHADGNG